MADKKIRVTLVKSTNGCKREHRATVRGLGLRRLRSNRGAQGHAASPRHDQQRYLSAARRG